MQGQFQNIVMDAVLFQKFSQDASRLELLVGTGDQPLFECTRGKVWGIGLIEEEARAAWWSGRPMQGDNLHGLSLMRVRQLLQGHLDHHQAHWVVGDSITTATASHGIRVLSLSGACISRVLLLCWVVLQLPHIASLIIHVGTNNIAPRNMDRSQLIHRLKRYPKRLRQKGACGDRWATLLRQKAERLAMKHPAVRIYISCCLPRPCDWVIVLKIYSFVCFQFHPLRAVVGQFGNVWGLPKNFVHLASFGPIFAQFCPLLAPFGQNLLIL